MEKHTLKASKRTILGKKVKTLRQQGFLPGNLYGKDIKSQSLQVDLKEFQKVYQELGETGLLYLRIGSVERPVLIHNVQLDPVSDLPLHTDFYQVSLQEKVTASVPVVFSGESPAVVNKQGVLLTILDEVEIEALPTDLPEKIELDISKLSTVDQELKVKDLKVDIKKITIKSDPNLTLVKVGPLVTKEVKKEVEAEEKAKAAEAAQAASPEGTTPSKEEEKPKTEEKK